MVAAAAAALFAKNAADESRKANRIAISDKRAWLTVDIQPASELDYAASGAPFVTLKISINNIGSFPASKIISEFKIVPLIQDSTFLADHRAINERLKVRGSDEATLGRTLFPNGVDVYNLYVQMSDEDWNKISKDDNADNWYGISIVGGINYAAGNGTRGTTPAIFNMFTFELPRARQKLFKAGMGRVPIDRLTITPSHIEVCEIE